ncbi:hypothetical protein BGZ50_008992 [Haplosporangium sp. Z 11]|nr:hypothetical protein BGZ50_008992 [Haplosporangium sp. Z 11]
MHFFKSSKNQTKSAAASAAASPVQSPRTSMQEPRPKTENMLTLNQALGEVMYKPKVPVPNQINVQLL